MTIENKILDLLKQGKTIKAISDQLQVKMHIVFKVRDMHRDELPKKKWKTRWSVRVSPELNTKMLVDIHERGITPSELLNFMIEKWYANS